MSTKTSIEWTDVSWNPVRGCSMVSAGCANCYAMKKAHRFSKPGMAYEGLTEIGPQGPRWNGKITLVDETLKEPFYWKTPRRVFVNSMSDLFHEDVPDEFIDRVFLTMFLARQHTFQILTKRPQRMLAYTTSLDREKQLTALFACSLLSLPGRKLVMREYDDGLRGFRLPNVWLGVSVEDQATADERIQILWQIPAAVRFISAEPLLGQVDLSRWLPIRYITAPAQYERVSGAKSALDWIICGGESGPGARPCDLAWIRMIKDQCQAAGMPVFVKQLGSKWFDKAARVGIGGSVAVPVDGAPWTWVTQQNRKGGDIIDSEFPVDLHVREFPR